MKAIKFMAMLLAAATLTFGAASCGDDDDEKGGSTEETIAELMELSAKKATLKATGTEISLVLDYGKYTDTQVAKFSVDKEGNNILTSWVQTITFSSAKVAQAAYEVIEAEIVADEDKDYIEVWKNSTKVSKNSIIADLIAIYEVEEEDLNLAYEWVEAWMAEDYYFAVEDGAAGSVSGVDMSKYEEAWKSAATRAAGSNKFIVERRKK